MQGSYVAFHRKNRGDGGWTEIAIVYEDRYPRLLTAPTNGRLKRSRPNGYFEGSQITAEEKRNAGEVVRHVDRHTVDSLITHTPLGEASGYGLVGRH